MGAFERIRNDGQFFCHTSQATALKWLTLYSLSFAIPQTCTVTANGNSNRRVQGDEFEDELQQDEETDDGRARLKVVFQPTYDTTHTIYYKGHWLRVRRSKKTDGSELQMLSISVVARSNTVLKQLVLEAKREYEKDTIHRVQIYFADSHGGWRYADSRHKRPLSSIVLGPGVKEVNLFSWSIFMFSC